MFRQLDHEELPGEIVVLLAGVVGAGKIVVRRSLKRQKCFAIANSGEVRGDAFAHEDGSSAESGYELSGGGATRLQIEIR